jgi:hypothetical protein
MPSSVSTEITGGHLSTKHGTEGASPKARKLLGWFRRASIDEPSRRMSGVEEDDVGFNQMPPTRESHSDETTNTGITVQYDVSRTVEELRRESSSQEGDVTIDMSDHKDGHDEV